LRSRTQRLYLIPVLSKALDILELLHTAGQPMTVEAIHLRTKISKTTVYRVLKTFVHRGYLSQAPDGTYRHVMRPKKLRFGFASQSGAMAFSEEVTRSLTDAAAAVGVDLMILDNRYDARTAVRNAEQFISSRVDLIIELNVEQEVAPLIGDKVAAAGIPMIAIDIPHPNAVFFGVDNFRVGVDAGEILAHYAKKEWQGEVDYVLGLDLPEAGVLVQGRISGAFEAIRSMLPQVPPERYSRLDGRGLRESSQEAVATFLDANPKARRILIAAATDTSAMGALDAVRKRRRQKHVAIVGQDCIPEALEEMRKPDSPLIGSISHEMGAYGPALMGLGLSIIKGQTVPPYNYVTHRAVTREALLRG
jgi:ribose transport system substrate-binding protein